MLMIFKYQTCGNASRAVYWGNPFFRSFSFTENGQWLGNVFDCARVQFENCCCVAKMLKCCGILTSTSVNASVGVEYKRGARGVRRVRLTISLLGKIQSLPLQQRDCLLRLL